MRYIITSLLVLCNLAMSAQNVKTQGQKHPQTQVAKQKPKTGSRATKQKQPKAAKSKSSAGKANQVSYTMIADESKVGYVDLGLPSGTLWADRNVGANRPEDCGEYFAWGEVKPKSNYTWSTYKYCTDSSGKKISKYVADSNYGNVDNRTTLESQDDAAYVNWGGSWRMPTIVQMEELNNSSYTTWTWTTRNGVNGYEVKSNRNGNSIFLPVSGLRCGGSWFDGKGYGYYWSSSLSTYGSDFGRYLLFYSGYHYTSDYGNRHDGFSVRPVYVLN